MVFMMKHSFSAHARMAKPPNSVQVTAGTTVIVDRYQKIVQEHATAKRCTTRECHEYVSFTKFIRHTNRGSHHLQPVPGIDILPYSRGEEYGRRGAHESIHGHG